MGALSPDPIVAAALELPNEAAEVRGLRLQLLHRLPHTAARRRNRLPERNMAQAHCHDLPPRSARRFGGRILLWANR